MSNNIINLLLESYINKAGRISASFGKKIHEVSPEIREAVLAEITKRGLKPYVFKPRKQCVQKPEQRTPKCELHRLVLEEVRDNIAKAEEWLKTLRVVEGYYAKMIADAVPETTVSVDRHGSAKFRPAQDPHTHTALNRRELESSTKCGCFSCGAIYHPTEITAWADNGQTAICPKCEVDSVIAEQDGIKITKEFLQEMYEKWFAN